ncbi:hypothetical protein SmJEL517_g05813 [Synchytrium microbalum]|uniref:Helicase ATP-binding domain-containing protein n=1 Tax=Synchytrium microbalum TaxID=1806994 RepID=A0A507BXZ9_9FUNG|nr:uncharacterized protein SmJEL517_g05813 [Synchytrium microbalum]TPX30674.1 hypothetical protein SmJEL517_g05813 [Synchytrium microbalum]
MLSAGKEDDELDIGIATPKKIIKPYSISSSPVDQQESPGYTPKSAGSRSDRTDASPDVRPRQFKGRSSLVSLGSNESTPSKIPSPVKRPTSTTTTPNSKIQPIPVQYSKNNYPNANASPKLPGLYPSSNVSPVSLSNAASSTSLGNQQPRSTPAPRNGAIQSNIGKSTTVKPAAPSPGLAQPTSSRMPQAQQPNKPVVTTWRTTTSTSIPVKQNAPIAPQNQFQGAKYSPRPPEKYMPPMPALKPQPISIPSSSSSLVAPKRVAPTAVARAIISGTVEAGKQQDLRALLESIPDDDPEMRDELVIPELVVKLLRHQVVGINWMKDREEKSKGGMLCDDMGLGKTIQAIGLICSNKPTSQKRRSTLVVSPLSVIKQWEDEILTRCRRGALDVLVHHGPSRTKSASVLKQYDVVITTYDTVSAEFSQKARKKKNDDSSDDKEPNIFTAAPGKESGPLMQVDWFRVILDEGHNIKNHNTQRAKACCALSAERRFLLSGTPLQNNVDDLFSILKFLRIKPCNDLTTFKVYISNPLNRGRSKEALQKVQAILKAIMLRRMKTTLVDGKPLLNLPARDVKLTAYELGGDEREYYLSLETKMQKKLKKYIKAGHVNASNVLAMLLRLRLCCNHPYLVAYEPDNSEDVLATEMKRDGNNDDEADVDGLVNMLGNMDVKTNQCSICLDPIEPESKDKLHCLDCTIRFVSHHGNDSGSKSKNGKNAAMLAELRRAWVSSTKIDELLSTLGQIYREDDSSKTIVFSQFTSMLDIVEIPLGSRGWAFCRYDGSMTSQAREDALKKFRTDPKRRILLISLGCGSVGLNLTCANRIVLLDLWWNPALEQQAIDRVHRIGQTKDVHVVRMTIKETVEERILALQEKKQQLVSAVDGVGKLNKTNVQELISLFSATPKDEADGDGEWEDGEELVCG